MDYNSDRNQLFFPEFGRNMQQMVRHALTLDTQEQRQTYIEYMVRLIDQMNPKIKGTSDDMQKLWKSIYVMTDNELKDVSPPEGIDVAPDETFVQPDPLPYPQMDPKYAHYGRYVEQLVATASREEDEDKRRDYINLIGSYMKVAYRNWGGDHQIPNETLKSDIKMMSKGVLEPGEEVDFDLFKTSHQDRLENGLIKKRKTRKKKNRNGGGPRKSNIRRHRR